MIYPKLLKSVWEWAETKQLDDLDKQLLKCLEEAGELIEAILKDYHEEDITKEIGDIGVVLIVIARILEIDVFTSMRYTLYLMKGKLGEPTPTDIIRCITKMYPDNADNNYNLGKCLLMLHEIAKRYNRSLSECIYIVHEINEARTHKLVNGIAIKSEDLK